MSKLNVNEIEATSTNTNVKVVPKGADATCEIKGDTDDATLQLNCSAQSHGVKLKAPANSAGQNYTMILPDNAPAVTTTDPANSNLTSAKVLKVKSVTGSGSSAVGQLEFIDQPSQDMTVLDASNVTSGSLPSARFPTISASNGAGLKLISKYVVGATSVSTVDVTFPSTDGAYRIIGKNINLDTNDDRIQMYFLDSSSNVYTGQIHYSHAYYISYASPNYFESGAASNYAPLSNINFVSYQHAFIGDFVNKSGANWSIVENQFTGTQETGRNLLYATLVGNPNPIVMSGVRFGLAGVMGTSTFATGSEFLLYQYLES